MKSDEKMLRLLTVTNALIKNPQLNLKENKRMLSQIKDVLNSDFLNNLLHDIKNDHLRQKDAELKTRQDDTLARAESLPFLKSYALFKSKQFETLEKKAATAYTKLPTQLAAVNALKETPEKPVATDTKEAKNFAKAFNSIFSDRSLQINTANDPTRIQSFIDYSPYIYNYQYYLSIPTLSQTIDKPIQIATKEMPEIITEYPELTAKIERWIKRNRFNESVRKMLLNSALSPRGSVMVPIQDEKGRIRFNVFNDTQFTYAVSPNYNKIDFHDNGHTVSQIFVLGHNLKNGVTCHFLCPGFEPIYGVGKNRLFQLKDAAEAINIYLYTVKVLCIRAQILVQKWGGEGQNDTLLERMQRLSDDIDSSLSLSTSVKLPEGAELDILNNNLSEGFAKIAPIIKEYQGMLTGVMSDFFYGSDTAYAANSFNIHATHQNIRSEIQEAQIEPMYRFMINTLLNFDNSFKEWEKEDDNFEIKFKSLYEPTDKERVEVDKMEIDNVITMSAYPDLEKIFKEKGLLAKEFSLPGLDLSDGGDKDSKNLGT